MRKNIAFLTCAGLILTAAGIAALSPSRKEDCRRNATVKHSNGRHECYKIFDVQGRGKCIRKVSDEYQRHLKRCDLLR